MEEKPIPITLGDLVNEETIKKIRKPVNTENLPDIKYIKGKQGTYTIETDEDKEALADFLEASRTVSRSNIRENKVFLEYNRLHNEWRLTEEGEKYISVFYDNPQPERIPFESVAVNMTEGPSLDDDELLAQDYTTITGTNGMRKANTLVSNLYETDFPDDTPSEGVTGARDETIGVDEYVRKPLYAEFKHLHE